jgi:glycosyltransferase involved in cell wall biosynthesis
MDRKKRLLLECFNLTLPKGTGIKTYATLLGKLAREIGYDVEALVQSNGDIRRRDPVLSDVMFFDDAKKPKWKEKYFEAPAQIALGAPFGLHARKLPRTGVVQEGERMLGGVAFDAVWAVDRFTLAAKRHFNRYGTLAKIRMDAPIDVFHATHLTPVKVPGAVNIYTIHDVIPLRLPRATKDSKKFVLNSLRAVCRDADHIVTVSEQSKKDILSLCPIAEDKITVTFQAAALPQELIDRPEDEADRIVTNVFGLKPNEYFLYFGAVEPKKNVSRLIDAYAASGAPHPLIIAGGLGWDYEGDLERIESEYFSSWRIAQDHIKVERRVRRFDHLPLPYLTALIQRSRSVLFPSLYEGFGLPVLEAMTLGAPVMTSNVSSLPEVAGEAAVLVDPYDVTAMAQAIRVLDADADLRRDLVVRGKAQATRFSQEAYRDRLAALYARWL